MAAMGINQPAETAVVWDRKRRPAHNAIVWHAGVPRHM